MAGRPPSRDEIDCALDVLDYYVVIANYERTGESDTIAHVAHLIEQDTRPSA